MFSIYTTLPALEMIVIDDDKYTTWNKILKKGSEIFLDITDKDFNEIWNLESDLFTFFSAYDIPTPYCHRDFFSELEAREVLLLNNPRAAYILSASSDSTELLQRKYGVIVQSDTSLNDDIFDLIHTRDFVKNEIIEGPHDGWSNLLSSIVLPPSNTLIISDNYLFKNNTGNDFFGKSNLINLLNSLLPEQLEVEFHVLVVTPFPNKLSKDACQKLVSDINSIVNSLRDYDIVLEFAFCESIHKRSVFSNYYNIVCDKGFAMFDIRESNKIKDENDFNLTGIFDGIVKNNGDSGYISATKRLSAIKKLCANLAEQHDARIDYTKCIFGFGEKETLIKNRILSSI